jgi:hypothetical protein
MRCKITNLPSKYTPYSNPEENTRDEFMQYHIGATADSQIALLVVPGISPAVSMMILVSIASIDSVLLTQGITSASVPPGLELDRTLHLSKHPSFWRVTFDDLGQLYGAQFFRTALARWIIHLN